MSSSFRVAVISEHKCKPKKCGLECKKKCPRVMMGVKCIEVKKEDSIAFISETLCIGCGICQKVCPFDAIRIVNLPKELTPLLSHQFSENSFRLYNYPQPEINKILGLIGGNGTGKTTTFRTMKNLPNLGRFLSPPSREEVCLHYRGSSLQNFFGEEKTFIVKPQHIDELRKKLELLEVGELEILPSIIEEFEIGHLLHRKIGVLSGGELQKIAISYVASKSATLSSEEREDEKKRVTFYDEPSSFLDIKQRIAAAKIIKEHKTDYTILVEHDLSILDYISDNIVIYYGVPSVYGCVSSPISTREGINTFLDGYLPYENIRFRKESISFRNISEEEEELSDTTEIGEYPSFTYSPSPSSEGGRDFTLTVEGGKIESSTIYILLGENGCGKTTLLRILSGRITLPDGVEIPELKISYKPQLLTPKFEGSVEELLSSKINRDFLTSPQFKSDVLNPLRIDDLLQLQVKTLSGGEIQRVALVLCLGQPADVYLIDEPSSYLDSEQRIIVTKVIRRFILNTKKTAFVVEHDFMMATSLPDKVILFTGKAGIEGKCHSPTDVKTGMNAFLQNLGVTFRRDRSEGGSNRPRINKYLSQNDVSQKRSGEYFVI